MRDNNKYTVLNIAPKLVALMFVTEIILVLLYLFVHEILGDFGVVMVTIAGNIAIGILGSKWIIKKSNK